MQLRQRWSGRSGLRYVAAALAVTAFVAACSSGSSGGSSSGSSGSQSKDSAPGITASTIKIGIVTSVSGPAAATLGGVVGAAQARFDLQNAKGGVDGRKIQLVVADDGGTPQGAQTAVNSLIQEKGVFAIIFMSVVTQTAFQAAQQAGVPVVGGALDGPEWGQQPNTNMVSINGNQSAYLPGYTYFGAVAKDAGATNLATLAIQGIPSSVIDNQNAAKAFEQAGIKVGYAEDSLALGTVNVGPIVLAMKNAKVNGFYSTMLDNTNFAIMTAAEQSGLKLKASIMAVGYGQALLDDPSAVQAGQGAILSSQQVPVEEHTPATIAEQKALKQYGKVTGVPDLNITDSWLSADLIVTGLEKAGKNPTRSSFLAALHNTTNWTAGGLLPSAPDLSLANFGKAPNEKCSYFVRLQGSDFMPLNGGKPYCGTAVP